MVWDMWHDPTYSCNVRSKVSSKARKPRMTVTSLPRYTGEHDGTRLGEICWIGIYRMSDGSLWDISLGSDHKAYPESKKAVDTVFFSKESGDESFPFYAEEAADCYENSTWEDVCDYCEKFFGIRPIELVAASGTPEYRKMWGGLYV